MTNQLRYIAVGHLAPQPRWSLPAHGHPFHELSVVLQGRMHLHIGGETLEPTAGDLLWYPAGTDHAERSDRQQPVETIFVAFAWENPPPLPYVQHDHDGRTGLMLRWLLEMRESLRPAEHASRQTLLAAIVCEFVRLATRARDPLVEAARAFMRERLSRKLTLAQIAEAAGLSKCHFLRAYKARTGRTPMQDLRLMRLAAARELLMTTDAPLKRIAPQAGLRDEYHLARLLRRHYRLTAGQIRGR